MFNPVKVIFGDANERELKRLRPFVEEINALEPDFEKLSADELRELTPEFRRRLQQGEDLDDLLPEAFAAVREAAKRTIGQRHFDVQLLGGMVLHQGKIAEMKTGEGKTLVATLPLYLNALEGRGSHLVTVNDYLARRDPYWMGPIYHALGVTVASIQHDSSYLYDPAHDSGDPKWGHLRPLSRQEAYRADITYGTNSEFGFDYLRDNMVVDLAQQVQRGLHYAIVDEVDNVLIDEARTPLIISGPAEESTQMYQAFAQLARRLEPKADYTIDEKTRTVALTEEGIAKVERALNVSNIYDPANYSSVHFLENAARAQAIYKRDRDYVVKDGEVIIVDEFTGRMMPGRRWSEGLHQAVEAKEGVKVQRETLTMATITLQNYFRMYHKLAGMTGTAVTEAEEFYKIYKLDVVVVPTNQPMVRRDASDQVYKTEDGKFSAVAKDIEERHGKGQPILVGTVSIEKSERLSALLQRRGVRHNVLNAKFHEKEAEIVAEAGRLGAVTIATNMAGRGTDIILGGNPDAWAGELARRKGLLKDGADRDAAVAAVKDEARGLWEEEHRQVVGAGGLHVVGTERHEARRIDNQLRGRSGRQGDPGSSRFYVSLEDDIMRRFGGDMVKALMDRFGLEEDVPLENPLVNRALANAQVKTEGYNFDIRKHLVDYDDVVNKHREVIYGERRKVLSGADLKANILEMIHKELESLFGSHLQEVHGGTWDLEGLEKAVRAIIPDLPSRCSAPELAKLSRDEIQARLLEEADAAYQRHEDHLGAERMRMLERLVMLQFLDSRWVEHLTVMENMRQGIGLRAIGQTDPLVVYKREGHEMFQGLLSGIQHDIVHAIYHANLVEAPPQPAAEPLPAGDGRGASAPPQRQPLPAAARGSATARLAAAARGGRSPVAAAAGGRKVGRNDPCPCGSGRKYKRCHGTLA
ncbi:MAG: preprotein translocase subunit SecA [Chloroflexi bacterium]|nr:preprotein translocase subunit SecA [Chloroflexota bacterium]